jgi:hypothetical protein
MKLAKCDIQRRKVSKWPRSRGPVTITLRPSKCMFEPLFRCSQTIDPFQPITPPFPLLKHDLSLIFVAPCHKQADAGWLVAQNLTVPRERGMKKIPTM